MKSTFFFLLCDHFFIISKVISPFVRLSFVFSFAFSPKFNNLGPGLLAYSPLPTC
ncbi:hypothetical protein BVRB_9g205350 [Beta vulgaris subsp. vulgaris]|nr:hypothetical protein BVRB_9g205350 [Beta vulgaris subsp. vulgaris]